MFSKFGDLLLTMDPQRVAHFSESMAELKDFVKTRKQAPGSSKTTQRRILNQSVAFLRMRTESDRKLTTGDDSFRHTGLDSMDRDLTDKSITLRKVR